jgi:hypothetical protein
MAAVVEHEPGEGKYSHKQTLESGRRQTLRKQILLDKIFFVAFLVNFLRYRVSCFVPLFTSTVKEAACSGLFVSSEAVILSYSQYSAHRNWQI